VRTIDQAGAIIAGLRNGEPATLLVTGKRNPGHWIFPKGHVERGESLDQTALREAEEEAGVRATLLGPAGALSFVDRGQTIRVHYFVVLTRDEGTPEDGRRIRWFPLDEALQRLTYDDSKALLKKAWPLVLKETTRLTSADSSRRRQ
jgi:bis(5'-nucleosidyl)-tetraphosphatase